MDVGQFSGPIIIALVIGSSLWYLGGFWTLSALLVLAAALFAWTFRDLDRGAAA